MELSISLKSTSEVRSWESISPDEVEGPEVGFLAVWELPGDLQVPVKRSVMLQRSSLPGGAPASRESLGVFAEATGGADDASTSEGPAACSGRIGLHAFVKGLRKTGR
jgi:hypothetical protein